MLPLPKAPHYITVQVFDPTRNRLCKMADFHHTYKKPPCTSTRIPPTRPSQGTPDVGPGGDYPSQPTEQLSSLVETHLEMPQTTARIHCLTSCRVSGNLTRIHSACLFSATSKRKSQTLNENRDLLHLLENLLNCIVMKLDVTYIGTKED